MLPLIHSPAEILTELLIALNEGTDPSLSQTWPVYVSNEPDLPDSVITIFDTVGKDNGRIMSDGYLVTQHGVQIRIRASDHPDGYEKASTLRSFLSGIYQRSVSIDSNSYTVHALSGIGQVLTIGKEYPTSRRNVYTLNGLIEIRRNV